MKAFLDKIDAINGGFERLGSDLRADLAKVKAQRHQAIEKAQAQRTRYEVMLVEGLAEDAAKLRGELGVAEDTVALLDGKIEQLEADLRSGEIVASALARHEAVVAAVHAEGNEAIAQAIGEAVRLRDEYVAALKAMVETQHRVAEVARRSVRSTAAFGHNAVPVPVVTRYEAAEFGVDDPAPSANCQPFA